MLLFAQLQSGIESGRAIEFRPEAGYRIEGAGTYQGLRVAVNDHMMMLKTTQYASLLTFKTHA